VLSKYPNSYTDIAPTLERQMVLRSFNNQRLGMENVTGTTLNQTIGMGIRTDPETGHTGPVTDFCPDYLREITQAFHHYPIAKTYGISPLDAMGMPVDRWKDLLAMAKELPEQKPDAESQMFQLLKQMLGAKTPTE
jgi:hypothetical protein